MTPEQSALLEAIEVAGGQSELARKLTEASDKPVKQQQVWNWLHREKNRQLSSQQQSNVLPEYLRKDCDLMYSKSLPPQRLNQNHRSGETLWKTKISQHRTTSVKRYTS